MALQLFDIVGLPKCFCVQSSVRRSGMSKIAIQTPSILVETGFGLVSGVMSNCLIQPIVQERAE